MKKTITKKQVKKKKDTKKFPVYLTIHGHFYQPPRENPWTEEIETQDSAAPFHDWNERINGECYRPNSISRVLDSQGRIKDIVNNFEYLSFNIGPTLMHWLEHHDPHTYQRILDADKKSMEHNNGHGNAIAQVYNHIIMPLANEQDKITQIKWGIADFRRRFDRKPEGIWLAETAINMPTVNHLIDQGIKYTILAPTQAYKVREFGGEWSDVSGNSIDPRKPYRIFYRDKKGKTNKKKYLDIFFYDGPISSSVAFEHLLRDASSFAHKLAGAINHDKSNPQLVNIGTDGESYGHHEAFGDMCLAYFFDKEAKKHGFTVTNYANYLEMYPPTDEVELKNYEGEGTAWSCAHGVGRWYKDCGCNTGAQEGWNQKWREPFRNALDELRGYMINIFENETKDILKDCWAARNDFINIIFDRSDKNLDKFFKKHQIRVLDQEERVRTLKLLEGQRNALLMYTSCAWFFAEISGIETVQNIKYASRAIQLYKLFSDINLEKQFISKLGEAISNISHSHNGDMIYYNWIKPHIINPKKVVNQLGINHLILQKAPKEEVCLHDTEILSIEHYPEYFVDDTPHNLLFMHVKTTDQFTKESKEFYTYSVQLNFNDFRSYVREIYSANDVMYLTETIRNIMHKRNSATSYEIKALFDGKYLTLNDIYIEESQELISNLIDSRTKEINDFFISIFNRNIDIIGSAKTLGIKLPPQLTITSKLAIERMIISKLKEKCNIFDLSCYEEVFNIHHMAKNLGIKYNIESVIKILSETLSHQMISIKKEYDYKHILNIMVLFEIAENLNIKLDIRTAENIMYEILTIAIKPDIKKVGKLSRQSSEYLKFKNLLQLAEHLNFNVDDYIVLLK